MSAFTYNRLGAKRWNALEDEVVNEYVRMEEVVIDALLADGYAPFTEPLDERALYETLVSQRMIPGSAYWTDPAAQATLTRLAAKYGPPPAPMAPPLGGLGMGGVL